MPYSRSRYLSLFLLYCGMAFVSFETLATPKDKAYRQLKALLETPEHKIDFARAKTTIDQIVDPSHNHEKVLTTLDEMVQTIKAMAGDHASDLAKLSAIRKYLYEKGPWNNFKEFQYDFSDPMGTNLNSKLLSHYMATKKGNCVSMPILFIILADRMGLDVSASMAPNHVLVKFTEPRSGKHYNIEATSGGGFARDQWYREQMNITSQAIESGIYLQKLSRKETVAVMTLLVGEFYFKEQEFSKAIEIFELVLQFDPKSVFAMLKAGSSYAFLLKRDFFNKYKTIREIPAPEQKRLSDYLDQNRNYYAKAESLGWREPSQESDKKYEIETQNARKRSAHKGIN